MRAEADFGLDSSKPSGRRSYCKACDRERGRAYYAAHRDELYAQREAVREAARQAHLKELEKEHRKRVAAAKKVAEARARRQKELLRSLGVPDLTPEEVSARARRRPKSSANAEAASRFARIAVRTATLSRMSMLWFVDEGAAPAEAGAFIPRVLAVSKQEARTRALPPNRRPTA
jgi:hypothetical protein